MVLHYYRLTIAWQVLEHGQSKEIWLLAATEADHALCLRLELAASITSAEALAASGVIQNNRNYATLSLAKTLSTFLPR
jgi:hypothetical protein